MLLPQETANVSKRKNKWAKRPQYLPVFANTSHPAELQAFIDLESVIYFSPCIAVVRVDLQKNKKK